jgi:hypothetical protein
MASALEAMMREQSPPRAGKSRMNPAPSLHPLIPLQQEPRPLVGAGAESPGTRRREQASHA